MRQNEQGMVLHSVRMTWVFASGGNNVALELRLNCYGQAPLATSMS